MNLHHVLHVPPRCGFRPGCTGEGEVLVPDVRNQIVFWTPACRMHSHDWARLTHPSALGLPFFPLPKQLLPPDPKDTLVAILGQDDDDDPCDI